MTMVTPGTAETRASGVVPSYEPLSVDQERLLVSQLLDASPELAEAGTRFGLVTIGPRSPFSNLARSVESTVFHEFFQNDPTLMAEEYGPYEQASLFFLVVDTQEARCAGAMRLLHSSEAGFKATNDLQAMGLTELSPDQLLANLGVTNPDTTLEIATIAAAPDYRGSKSDGLTSGAMYRALYQYCNANGYSDLIAIIDGVPMSLLQAMHLPVAVSPDVASPFVYLDAKTNSFMHIPIEPIERTMRAQDNALFDNLLGTPGLDPFIVISHAVK